MSNLQRFGIEHSIATKNPAPRTIRAQREAIDDLVRGGLVHTPRLELADIRPAHLKVDLGAYECRIASDGTLDITPRMRGHELGPVIYDEAQHFHGDIFTSNRFTLNRTIKEDPMPNIDQSQFVAKTNAQKVKADSLAAKHLGSLVTITLPSGAEITDVLEGVHSGRLSEARTEQVVVVLANVGHGFNVRTLQDGYGEHRLDPGSVVLVRRPRAPRKAAKR